jgi:hypothetical protein
LWEVETEVEGSDNICHRQTHRQHQLVKEVKPTILDRRKGVHLDNPRTNRNKARNSKAGKTREARMSMILVRRSEGGGSRSRGIQKRECSRPRRKRLRGNRRKMSFSSGRSQTPPEYESWPII